MKIEESKIHYITKDNNSYTRHSPNNWTISMGESDEQVYDCTDLEQEFQKKNISNDDALVCNCCGRETGTEDIICLKCADAD